MMTELERYTDSYFRLKMERTNPSNQEQKPKNWECKYLAESNQTGAHHMVAAKNLEKAPFPVGSKADSAMTARWNSIPIAIYSEFQEPSSTSNTSLR